jgi:hypothetical protein
MPMFYHIDKARKLVMTSASGVLSREDVITHFQKLQNDPDLQPHFSELGDFTHVIRIDLTAEDIREFARTDIFSSQSRRAVVVGDDSAAVLAEMFALLRQVAGERGIRVFRRLEDGIDWIIPNVMTE